MHSHIKQINTSLHDRFLQVASSVHRNQGKSREGSAVITQKM